MFYCNPLKIILRQFKDIQGIFTRIFSVIDKYDVCKLTANRDFMKGIKSGRVKQ